MDSQFFAEDYRLYGITLRATGAEQPVKQQETVNLNILISVTTLVLLDKYKKIE